MTSPKGSRKRESNTSYKSAHSTPRKSIPSFDLASVSKELPPNTGPPDTTSTSNGSTSSSNSNKSLSHVPCKFFRQGICQAGKSCPFSHDLDGTAPEKVPCKYFQKGNCKFGSKCALAHILPDGTHINAKTQSHSRRSNGRHERSGSHNNPPSNQTKYSGEPNPVTSASHQQPPCSQSAGHESRKKSIDYENFFPNEYLKGQDAGESFEHADLPYAQGEVLSQQVLYPDLNAWSSYYSSNILCSPQSLAHNPRRNTFNSTTNQTSLWLEESPIFQDSGTSSMLQSNAPSFGSRSFSKHSLGGSASSPLYNYTRLSAEESTSVDEDSDAFFGDDDANFEDYVPASIGNLILTPQEQQRRESRSQSGTLLVRPNVSCQEEKPQGPIELITRGFDDVFLID